MSSPTSAETALYRLLGAPQNSLASWASNAATAVLEQLPVHSERSGYARGMPVDRSGIAQYLHIIRAGDDPERSPRPPGGRKDRAPHGTLAENPISTCETHIPGLLGDGVPRTFNRIGVELLGHTADALMGSPYDDALWNLVDRAELEHTLDAPILFRVPSDADSAAPAPAIADSLIVLGSPGPRSRRHRPSPAVERRASTHLWAAEF